MVQCRKIHGLPLLFSFGVARHRGRHESNADGTHDTVTGHICLRQLLQRTRTATHEQLCDLMPPIIHWSLASAFITRLSVMTARSTIFLASARNTGGHNKRGDFVDAPMGGL
jgi:hypothetical protein